MSRAMLWILWWLLQFGFALVNYMRVTGSDILAYISSLLFKEFDVDNFGIRESKRPINVAVVMESVEARKEDGKILQLLLWLVAANVQHISLYDPEGTLKNSLERLQGALNSLQCKEQRVCCYSHKEVAMRNDLQFSCGQLSSREQVPLKDGEGRKQCESLSITSRECLRKWRSVYSSSDAPVMDLAGFGYTSLELLCLQDGKEAIVNAARHICENTIKNGAVQHPQIKNVPLTEDDVDLSLLLTGHAGPDPDLLLLFGNTKCLLGFPPWRLRVTEIMHMGTMKDLKLSYYRSALKEFSKKVQRFGR